MIMKISSSSDSIPLSFQLDARGYSFNSSPTPPALQPTGVTLKTLIQKEELKWSNGKERPKESISSSGWIILAARFPSSEVNTEISDVSRDILKRLGG
ncbi:potassium voltage-gated channel subfamily E member 3 isoform X4 [Trachypithecus francoisi]|uniref:potassium voltage-gated channel subfamily E member 3 isoform X4 n=1 Tax=Trachypithecus francoisi TaxID=54180 RepID=UPI00141B145B|nr:potassium voltage-gated channel subfamily E member 3 isoform X4 [Trachypithecus francoisi]